MTDWGARAFDLVTEITKQVLTLATGIVAISITFFKDFASHSNATARALIESSWVIYALSVLFGLMTLMACAGHQQSAADQSASTTINAGNIRLLGGVQLVLFFAAVVLTVIAGANAV